MFGKKKMPTLRKRQKNKEAKGSMMEDGGSNALKKELINVEARSFVIEHAFRNMLTMLSFGMVLFSLYHAMGDMNTNIYMSTFELSNAVLAGLCFRYARDRSSPTFVKYLVAGGLGQFLLWGYLITHEYVYHVHCLPLGLFLVIMSTGLLWFMGRTRVQTMENISTYQKMARDSR